MRASTASSVRRSTHPASLCVITRIAARQPALAAACSCAATREAQPQGRLSGGSRGISWQAVPASWPKLGCRALVTLVARGWRSSAVSRRTVVHSAVAV